MAGRRTPNSHITGTTASAVGRPSHSTSINQSRKYRHVNNDRRKVSGSSNFIEPATSMTAMAIPTSKSP